MVTETRALEQRIRQELPSLSDEQVRELVRVLRRLVHAFEPEQIYAFGSRARADARLDSDVDLMVVVAQSDEPGYRRDQAAYRAIEWLRTVPIDVLVWTRSEFDERTGAPGSLPATILREGRLLYAA